MPDTDTSDASDAQAPDSVSFKRLSELLGHAPAGQEAKASLLGSSVPVLPLDSEDFGALDLVVTLEQMLKAARGATALHMLHAGSFLLHCAADNIERRMRHPDVDVSGMTGLLFKAASVALVTTIRSCTAAIDDFTAPLTRLHAERFGGGPGSRKGLVHDGTLDALGIDVESFDREFNRRLGD